MPPCFRLARRDLPADLSPILSLISLFASPFAATPQDWTTVVDGSGGGGSGSGDIDSAISKKKRETRGEKEKEREKKKDRSLGASHMRSDNKSVTK